MKDVWACGGGTQSAAIAGLIYEGKLPSPDHALMVDTEREKSSTWRYVYGTIKPRLAEVGVDLVIIPKSQYATVDLYAHNGDLLIPAYTADGVGKLGGFCSNEWKARVINRWLRDRGIGAAEVVTWKGFSLGELSRMRAGRFRYPLVFEYPMRRSDCRVYVASLGWDEPPAGGSACWMCPEMGNKEWLELRDNDPADFAKACDFDREIRQRDANVFVHRSGRPLVEIAPYLDQQHVLTGSVDGCRSGHCFM